MNSFCISNSINSEPEVKYLDNNIPVARWKCLGKENNGENPEFSINCKAFGKLANFVAENFKIGHQVTLEGRLEMNLIERNGRKEKIPMIICSKTYFSSEIPF